MKKLFFLGLLIIAGSSNAQVPAFPGVSGGGAASSGGRAGVVYEVTNLDDSGAGSLREGIDMSGPRTIVFRVGGTIQLLTDLNIVDPYLTIAGQTAPGGGILLSGENLADYNNMLRVATHDVIIRYIRIRTGRSTHTIPNNSGGCISIEGGSYNVLVDHVSLSWNRDEGIGIWSNDNTAVHNVTLSWNLTAEGLAGHPTGLLMGSDDSALSNKTIDIDSHHSMIMNDSHRNPLIKIKSFRYVNNILYNWSFYATMLGPGVNIDIIGNLYKPGPLNAANRPHKYEIEVYPVSVFEDQATGSPSVYVIGNKGPNNSNPNDDNWKMVGKVSDENGTQQGGLSRDFQRISPLAELVYPITTDPVENIESVLLPAVGASQTLDCEGNLVSNRDSVDIRLINQYQTNTGNSEILYSESEVGGFPTIAEGPPCTDTDHDGMPDAWENANGLDPNNEVDRNGTTVMSPFTNLEAYLSGKKGSLTEIAEAKQINTISVYPNPFTNSFHLTISSNINIKNTTLKIYSVSGKEVKNISISNYETIVDKDELQSGIYFYRISNNKEIIGNGKLIVQ